jgi:hypothetical protein
LRHLAQEPSRLARSGNRCASATASRIIPILSLLRVQSSMATPAVARRSSVVASVGMSVLNCSIRETTSRIHHGGEERPLIGEAGIDRRLSRARGLVDLVDACAFESTLQEDLAGRIEDTIHIHRDLPKFQRAGGQCGREFAARAPDRGGSGKNSRRDRWAKPNNRRRANKKTVATIRAPPLIVSRLAPCLVLFVPT